MKFLLKCVGGTLAVVFTLLFCLFVYSMINMTVEFNNMTQQEQYEFGRQKGWYD